MITTVNSGKAKRDGENDVSRDTFLLRHNLHREERNTSVFRTCSLSLNERVFTNACSLSSFRVWKCCLQVEHSRTDPRVWTCRCLMRPSAYMKDFSHWLHWCLFTPEWLQWGKETIFWSLTILWHIGPAQKGSRRNYSLKMHARCNRTLSSMILMQRNLLVIARY